MICLVEKGGEENTIETCQLELPLSMSFYQFRALHKMKKVTHLTMIYDEKNEKR